MVIGIIGAMDEEIAILLNDIEEKSEKEKAAMTFIKGKLYGKNIVIVRCGIGKVNAGICTQILVDDFSVDSVINVGIAGGIGKDVNPGDIVIGNKLVQHDVDATGFGYKKGEIPRMETLYFNADTELVSLAKNSCNLIKDYKSHVGIIASGDQFISSREKTRAIKDNFEAICCEMEGASIAQVAYLNKIAFLVIRSISDNADNDAHMDYDKFQDIAISNSTIIIRDLIKNI